MGIACLGCRVELSGSCGVCEGMRFVRRVSTSLEGALLLSCLLSCVKSRVVAPDLARMGDRGAWKVVNSDPRGGIQGGLAVATLDPHGGDGPGSNVALALVEGLPFTEGTIDVDLKGGGGDQPSFLGVAFGVDDLTSYEAVYFRPFRFGAAEPEQAMHAVQYVAWPDHPWRRLRDWSPNVQEGRIHPVPDPAGWFHAHIEVESQQVLVFVDGSPRPCLVVNRLRTADRGGVGLWTDGYEGSFANLKIVPAARLTAVPPPPSAPDWSAIAAAPDRSAKDRRLDAGRHPAEMLAFLDVHPGMRVAELGAGPGYTSELLARAVGRRGTVYMQDEPAWLPFLVDALRERFSHAVMASPSVIRASRHFEDPLPPEARNLDVVVVNLIYHDVIDKTDRAAMNRHVFDALRPGGAYVLVDSSAPDGSGVSVVETLHRIDEAVVKDEVIRAGFRLQAEGSFLRNPADRRDWNAAPEAAEAAGRRGTSDRFALRFIRPLTTEPTWHP
jgi:predicted methyltransferase